MTAGGPGQRVTVGDLTFRAFVSDPPRAAARTFVLVHGVGTSHRYFARLRAVLVETDAVVTVDLPGFGGMPKPGRDVPVATMAAALATVLDELGVRDAVLVGHSMGTQWAVELAAQRPDLASHVVVLGPVTDERHRSVAAQAVALSLDVLREPPSANALVLTDYVRCGPRWYAAQVRHMVAYRLDERVRALTRPLLVVRGGSDHVAGDAWCRRIRDAAPRASFASVPGRPHLVQYAAPRAVAAAMRSFLARA